MRIHGIRTSTTTLTEMPTPPHRSRLSTPSTSYYGSQTPGAESMIKPEKSPGPAMATLDSDVILPAPVVHFSSGSFSGRRRTSFRERATHRLREAYDSVMGKFGSGTAPSDSSTEPDPDTDSTLEGEDEDMGRMRGSDFIDGDTVDKIVVDREWGEGLLGSSTHSEHGEERSGSGPAQTDRIADAGDEFAGRDAGCWTYHPLLMFLRMRLWPSILKFFVMQFVDEKSEQQYRWENWYLRKVRKHFCRSTFCGVDESASTSDYGLRLTTSSTGCCP